MKDVFLRLLNLEIRIERWNVILLQWTHSFTKFLQTIREDDFNKQLHPYLMTDLVWRSRRKG